MRWYQVDSDTPNDPKIKRLLQDAAVASGGPESGAQMVGHLFLVWCFVANHGAQPGLGVKPDGSPLDLKDLAYEAGFRTVNDLCGFLKSMADRGLIGLEEWESDRVVFLPAMKARADAYAKSKGRGPTGGGGDDPVKNGPQRAPAGRKGPIHNTTGHHSSNPSDPSDQAPPADLLTGAGDTAVDALVKVWNTERKPGPAVRDITDQRRAAFGRALKVQPDLLVWRQVIRWFNTQPWCNGRGSGDHANWTATLDFLAKPGKIAQYHDKATADQRFLRAEAGAGTSQEGRNAAKGRTGFKRGEFAAALEGDDDGGHVH